MITTHSIRQKSSKTPILTLVPKFFQKIKSCHPDAVVLMLAKFKTDYKKLTGKEISLDYSQHQELMNLWNAKNEVWQSKFSNFGKELHYIINHYKDGVLQSTQNDMDSVLTEAQCFFNLIEQYCLKQELVDVPNSNLF